MGITDDYRAAVGLLRGWGFKVVEWSGCYGRSNGIGWSGGRPAGHGNHHYVCSMNPDQGYINGLVGNCASGTVVNWFADVHGVAYLIGTGPMNHFGTGNQSVLDRTRKDQAPTGPANAAGSITGNAYYSGTECQHPGDSTPWPAPMLDVMVAINAAEFLVWGYTAARAINHYEWTSRKIDMSAGGGRNSSGGWAGDELRRRVAARMSGNTTPAPPTSEDEDDMMRLIKGDTGNGATFAYSAGRFFHVPSPTHVEIGVTAQLWDGNVKVVPTNHLDVLRDDCIGNGEGKGDNLTGTLPSAISAQ